MEVYEQTMLIREATMTMTETQTEQPRRNTDDVETLGGRSRRPTVRDVSWRPEPPERPTVRLVAAQDTESAAPRPVTIRNELPPPGRGEAVQLAQMFLSGPIGQRSVGRDGCEAMARRILADEDDRTQGVPGVVDAEILALARSFAGDQSGQASMARRTCIIALGLEGGVVGEDVVAQARAWCAAVIRRPR